MLILPDWLIIAGEVPPLERHGLRTAGGLIQDVAPNRDLLDRYPGELVLDADGHVVLPGFVDTHTRLHATLIHGLPVADGGLVDTGSFLDKEWWPQVEDAIDGDMVASATDWACAELVRSGVTSFYDILKAPSALGGILLRQKQIVEERGLRGRLSFEATERAGPDIARRALAENVELIDNCSRVARAPSRLPLIDGLMCWDGTATSSPDYIAEAFGLATDRGVMSHARCNEGAGEGDSALADHGMRTVELYDDLGVAGPSLLASQCAHLSEREQELLVERDVRVSHLPLVGGDGGSIANVPDLVGSGVTVGLGSDGHVSDFYQVIRGAIERQRARWPSAAPMSTSRLLTMATEHGARAIGLERVGRLEIGWAADVQVVEASFPSPASADNLVEQLLMSREVSDVRDVLVSGRWRVRNHCVLDADLEQLEARTREQARRLLACR